MKKHFKSFILVLALIMLGVGYAMAQEAAPSPSPVASIEALDKVVSVMDKITEAMASYAGVIGTVLMVLWTVAKRISTEKAPKIVGVIQMGFDGVAKILAALGRLCAKVAEFLAAMVKSDGIGGVK